MSERRDSRDALLQVTDLKVHFPFTSGPIWRRSRSAVRAVDGISFDIYRGETLGLVGESGCGKSTTGRAILQLVRPTEGSVRFDDQELTELSMSDVRRARRKMQMIFQDPYASLNPRMTLVDIIGEPLEIHNLATGKAKHERVQELLSTVGLSPYFSTRYPHEFSGGQRQRIGIARALAASPLFVVCDEPISALDVSIQAQVINLLMDLQSNLDLTYLLIAHDLSMIRHVSDRIAVMYLGKIMELADQATIHSDARHPYTQALLSAVPIPAPKTERQRHRILLTGDVPSPIDPPSGCRFRTRCWLAKERCAAEVPAFRELESRHWIACHYAEETR